MRGGEIAGCELTSGEPNLVAFNELFSQDAPSPENWHSELPRDRDLEQIFSHRESRTVGNDWTVRWKNQHLQLGKETTELVKPGDRVCVCVQLDGEVRLFRGDDELRWRWSPESIKQPQRSTREKASQKGRPTGSSQGHKPNENHPWRNGFATHG